MDFSALNPLAIYYALRDFLETGGPVLMWIMGVTFLMWTLIMERYWFFFTALPFSINRAKKEWSERSDHSSWAAHQVREAILSDFKIEVSRNMSIVRTLVAVAPLFGLLGTVTGMIEVFDVMAFTGASNARAMASGVSKATIPTMAGMMAAISGLFFTSQLDRIINRTVRHIEDELDVHPMVKAKGPLGGGKGA